MVSKADFIGTSIVKPNPMAINICQFLFFVVPDINRESYELCFDRFPGRIWSASTTRMCLTLYVHLARLSAKNQLVLPFMLYICLPTYNLALSIMCFFAVMTSHTGNSVESTSASSSARSFGFFVSISFCDFSIALSRAVAARRV